MGCKVLLQPCFIMLIPRHRFRWVFCQLEVLRYCFPSSVRYKLDELPETLDETYERMLRGIQKAKRDHARHLLQCSMVAACPLRIAELAEVLAIDFRTARCNGISKLNINWQLEDHQYAVLSTRSSLITVVDQEDTQVVQFSHFSVKEFLTSPRLARSNSDASRFHIPFEPAHAILAKACLGVLLRLDDRLDRYDISMPTFLLPNMPPNIGSTMPSLGMCRRKYRKEWKSCSTL